MKTQCIKKMCFLAILVVSGHIENAERAGNGGKSGKSGKSYKLIAIA
jgi:hypothetical protein